MKPIKSAPPAWQMRSKGASHISDTEHYSTNRRADKVIERTRDGHAVLIECPFCDRLHIHSAPTAADPLRLRKAVCNQARVYVLGEDLG